MTRTDWSSWDNLKWRRRLETFGDHDASVLASGPGGETDAVWYDYGLQLMRRQFNFDIVI